MAEGEAAPGFKLPEIEPGFDEWLRSQLEASPADEKDTDDFKFLTFSELPPFTDEHKSLMRKTMTPELFAQLIIRCSRITRPASRLFGVWAA